MASMATVFAKVCKSRLKNYIFVKMNEGILYISAGISFAFAILNLLIGLQKKSQKFYLYFGIFSLFASFYFFFGAIDDFTDNRIAAIRIFSAAVYYSAFPWFIGTFLGVVKRKVLWSFSFIFLTAFLLFIMHLSTGSFEIWQIVAHVGLLGLMIYTAYAVYVSFDGSKSESRLLAFLTIVFTFLGLEEIVHLHLGFQLFGFLNLSFLPLDFYPLLFSVVIGTKLGNDIFQKNKLEIQLKDREIRWGAMMDSVNLIIIEVDQNDVIQYVNPYFGKISYSSPEEVHGIRFWQVFGSNNASEFKNQDKFVSWGTKGPGKENIIIGWTKNAYNEHHSLYIGAILEDMEDVSNMKGWTSKTYSLEQFEKDYIISVLERTNWKINGKKGAAECLHLHPNTLRSKMKKMDIERPKR
jgi:PAS domain-containing protein